MIVRHNGDGETHRLVSLRGRARVVDRNRRTRGACNVRLLYAAPDQTNFWQLFAVVVLQSRNVSILELDSKIRAMCATRHSTRFRIAIITVLPNTEILIYPWSLDGHNECTKDGLCRMVIDWVCPILVNCLEVPPACYLVTFHFQIRHPLFIRSHVLITPSTLDIPRLSFKPPSSQRRCGKVVLEVVVVERNIRRAKVEGLQRSLGRRSQALPRDKWLCTSHS